MNPAHIHLLLNHFPVIGTVMAIALLSYAVLRRSPELIRTGLGALVILAMIGGGVFLTGEPAEEAIEELPWVIEATVERHEEAALLATLLLGAVGMVALAGLVMTREPSRAPRVGRTVLALAILPAAMLARAAYLGGQIRHAEIRPDAVAPAAPEVTRR